LESGSRPLKRSRGVDAVILFGIPFPPFLLLQPSRPGFNHDGAISFNAYDASPPIELKGLEESPMRSRNGSPSVMGAKKKLGGKRESNHLTLSHQ
jgi:hypothetical protein